MTPVFCCGFECGVPNVASPGHFRPQTNSSIVTSPVRSGSRSGRVNPSGATGFLSLTGLTSSNKWVMRVYVRFATLPNAVVPICTTTTGTNGAWFNSADNKIYAGGASGTLGATGISVTTGNWYLLDIKVDQSANPHLVDVSVDNSACGQASIATAGAATTGVNLGNSTVSSTCDMNFDDFICSQTLADYPIGAGYVNHFIPTSDGTHNIAGTGDFQRTLTGTDILNATTTAFQLVDDVPLEAGAISLGTQDYINMVAPPNATDYVECVFGPASGISTPTVAPRTAEVIAAIAQAGTGTGNMEIRLNDNGTTGVIYTATGVAGVTTIAYKRAHFLDPPSAASVWTLSGNGNFNNIRFRFGSPAAVDANPDQYLVSIMIEAEFAEAGAVTALPGVGALTLTGFVPVINLAIFIGLGALALAGFAPIVAIDKTITTGLGAITLTGFAPVVTATQNQTASTGLGQLTLNGFSPQVNTAINTGLGALTLNGFTSQVNHKINTNLGQLTLTGLIPTVTATQNQTVTTGLGALILNGFSPESNIGINTGLGQLTLNGLALTIATTNNQIVSTGLGALTLNGFATIVDLKINTGLGDLTLSGLSPVISISDNQIASPGVGQLKLDGLVPQSNLVINTDTGILTLNGLASEINQGINTETGQLTLTGFIPKVSESINTETGQLTLTGFIPQVNESINTDTGQLTLDGFSPDLALPGVVYTETGQLILDGFAPTINITVPTDLGQLILSGLEPQVNESINTELGQLILNGFEPSVEASSGTTVNTDTGILVLNGFEPDIIAPSGPVIINIGTGILVLNGYAPTLSGVYNLSCRENRIIFRSFDFEEVTIIPITQDNCRQNRKVEELIGVSDFTTITANDCRQNRVFEEALESSNITPITFNQWRMSRVRSTAVGSSTVKIISQNNCRKKRLN